MRKSKLIVLVLISLILIVLFLRFIAGGGEDAWICENGSWVMHGHPDLPQPTTKCN